MKQETCVVYIMCWEEESGSIKNLEEIFCAESAVATPHAR